MLECGKKGPRLKAYLDRNDENAVPTIGVGQIWWNVQGKIRRVEMGDSFASVEDALQAFYKRLQTYEATVDACTRDDISQVAFDSFTSFCWNIGQGAFARARAVKFLNAYSPVDEVARAIETWDDDPVLVSRRKCEAHLMRTGEYKTQGEV